MNVLEVTHAGGIDWSRAIAPCRSAARALLETFDRTVQETLGDAGAWALARGAQALRSAFEGFYGGEVEGIARSLDVEPGSVLLGNLAYDLTNAAACSTVALAGAGAPVLVRNLDWAFPGGLLREHTIAVRVSGAPAGPYAMVTWPGFFGGLTAVAPGRFSVAVNFVSRTDDRPEHAFSRAARGYWPVPWAVRAALDECADYRAAVEMLETVHLLSPALFTVTGVRPGEAAVVERAPETHVTRRPERGSVCTTNHYVSARFREPEAGLWDSEQRLSTLERVTRTGAALEGHAATDAAFELLSRPFFLREETQHQVAMCAADGSLVVRVPGRGEWQLASQGRNT